MRRRESGPWVAGIVAFAGMLVALAIAFVQLLPTAGPDFCAQQALRGGGYTGYTGAGSSVEPQRSPRIETNLSLVPLEQQCISTVGEEEVGVYSEGPGWWPVFAVGGFALIIVLAILTPAIRNARSQSPVRASG